MPFLSITPLTDHRVEATTIDYPQMSATTLGAIFAEVETVLPFRVRFTNIDIGGYSPSNPAPIGIAIIGFNNYIL